MEKKKTGLISNQLFGTFLTPFPILQMKHLQNIRITQDQVREQLPVTLLCNQ